MNKKQIISFTLMTLAIVFMTLAIVGATLGCTHALILIAPAVLASVFPTISFFKSLKNKKVLFNK